MAEKENDEEGWKFTASEDTSCKISLLVCTAGFRGRGHFCYPLLFFRASGIIYNTRSPVWAPDNTGWGTLPDCFKVQLTSNEEMSNDAPIHEYESEIDH